ncbi:MAG: imidazole glycerol phosphate synthase subunit HisH [Gemmatimonadota bacterium]
MKSGPRIGILNLEMGNLRSVWNAVYSLGYDPCFVEGVPDLDGLTHLIVPGVGAFHTAVNRLRERCLAGGVCDFSASGRPLLGLCLGMQLLSSSGDEGGGADGLGLIPGCVERLDDAVVPTVPHVGWNSVDIVRDHPVLAGVKSGVDFYFVHSFRLVPDDTHHIVATTTYGERFASVIRRDNVVGFQFHPEKSQANGLKLLANFCEWDGMC